MVHLRNLFGYMELEYPYSGIIWMVIWDPNKAIDIGEWSICGGGRLQRFCCKYMPVYGMSDKHRRKCFWKFPRSVIKPIAEYLGAGTSNQKLGPRSRNLSMWHNMYCMFELSQVINTPVTKLFLSTFFRTDSNFA